MDIRCKKYLSRVVGILLGFSLSTAYADIPQDRAEGIAWLLTHQNGDGSWGEAGAKVAATAEALAALRHSGADSGFLYSRALSWLANVRADSNDSLARKISALSAAGFDVNELGLVDDLLSRRNEQLGWGAFEGHRSGFPDTALALMAINDAGVEYTDLNAGLLLIRRAQANGDSGWSYMAGNQGIGQKQQIMPSAYNLMALSAFQSGSNSSSTILRGVNWLVNTALQSDGSMLEDSTITTGSVHKTALGYLAIKASVDAGAVIDMETVLGNAQTYILAQQADDGGWEDDPLSTALALRTLPSTAMTDTDGDGIPDAVETLLGTDPSTPDGRDLHAGNGLDPDNLQDSGLTAPAIIQEVLVGSSFSSTPSVTGGVSPYIWRISSGGLPGGIHLQSRTNGILSGTPTTPGASSFALLVQDADANNLVVPGFIRVLALDDYITDTDMDGAPSVFEINQGFDPIDSTSTPVIDTDGDQVADWLDQFPDDPSEWADNDSMPDSRGNLYGLNPDDNSDANIDSDGDNLTNLEESSYNTDPFAMDTDNDGVQEDMEIALGSDPNLDGGPCRLSGWEAHHVLAETGELITLHSYQRRPGYLPGDYLAPQVVVLSGAKGEVECENRDVFNNIGSKASNNGRQAITLNLNYWENGRNTVEMAATYVVNVLNQLVESGYLRSSFYLMGSSVGTAIISAALDNHPSFVNRVDRAIFVSGPFNGIGKSYIQNHTMREIMDTYQILNLDSLDAGMAYNPTRYNQWIKPILDKKGLRFYVAEDDDLFCLNNHEVPFSNYECQLGTMDLELLNWVNEATDGTEDRASFENLGVLRIFQQGGHELLKTHPELLNSAFEPQ